MMCCVKHLHTFSETIYIINETFYKLTVILRIKITGHYEIQFNATSFHQKGYIMTGFNEESKPSLSEKGLEIFPRLEKGRELN